MNKRLKATVCAAVATCSFLAVQGTTFVKPIGVDVVSAATGTTSTPTTTTTPSQSTTTTKTTSYTTNYSWTKGSKLLKMGSVGTDVKSLQTTLNSNGYKLNVDGIFGSLTLNAVKDFQKQNGLAVDGVVGPNTYGKLYPTVQTVLLTINSTGTNVKSLQSSLNNYGYKLNVDGIFGSLTLSAVKDFQKQHGLVVDGIVGPNTYEKLNPTTATTTTTTTAVPTAILGIGKTGSDVKYLQENLNKVGYKLDVDGVFGSLTLNAVKDFQKSNGLTVDGLAGPKTFAKLIEKVTAAPTTTPTQPVEEPKPPVDVVSSASIVDNADAFQKAIVPKSKGGKWISAITKDITTDKALVLDGQFVNTKTPPALQRKIALYSQDDNHKVTARFNLTAPKLTILSPNASIEHGNFKGDLYVSASNFKLVNAKIDGNIYFTNKSAQDTFTIADKADDLKTVITGKQELKLTSDVDVATSASIVNSNDAFEKAISKDGKWIIAVLNNLTFNKEIVLDGTFNNTKTPPVQQRKIALYAHDDNKVTDARFILTAPKLTIKSPSASIQHGVFIGDVYVSAPNFSLTDAVIVGNIYFTSSEYKSTFKMDADSTITGQQWVNN